MHLFTDGTPPLIDTGALDLVGSVFENIEASVPPTDRVIITRGEGDHA